jgi:hypothetical protein
VPLPPFSERYTYAPGQHAELDYSRVICRDCSTRSTVVTIPAEEQETHEVEHRADRHAILRGRHNDLHSIRHYLPSNYIADSDGNNVFLHGFDVMGWTLDGYVLPRLASGMYYGREINTRGEEI